MIQFYIRVILASLWMLNTGLSIALTADVPGLEGKVARAKLIFDGTVTKITARQSVRIQNGSHRPGDPYNFYTFRVDQILKGAIKGGGNEITLRFMGGSFIGDDGKPARMKVPGMPSFALGDRAILYVEDTKRGFSPLVASVAHDRICRPDNLPYGDQEAWITKDKEVIFKPSAKKIEEFAEMIRNDIEKYHGLFDRLIADIVAANGDGARHMTPEGNWEPPAGSIPYTQDAYAAILAQRIRAEVEKSELRSSVGQGTAAQRAQPMLAPVESQDSEKPFYLDESFKPLDSRGHPLR